MAFHHARAGIGPSSRIVAACLGLALLVISAPSSAVPIKLDPRARTLPGLNVATSSVYDKSDDYKVDNNDWIVRLLPEQPTYLRSPTANFADVLAKAFPTTKGWSYVSSAVELSNDSLLVHTYDAQYGSDIVPDPTTGKWSRIACTLCQGAEFDIEYQPHGTDPLQNVHWIQVVTSEGRSVVDGAAATPYYDLAGLADSRHFFDFPIRGGRTQQEWDAELFLVSGPGAADGPGQITVYGGLHWGWENHNRTPEPGTLLLVGFAAWVGVRRGSRGRTCAIDGLREK